jgi:transposase
MGKVSSITLLKTLMAYGSPAAFAADRCAAKRLAGWGGSFLKEDKRQRFLASAASSVGVRTGAVEGQRIQAYAAQALQARREMQRAQKRLRSLAADQAVLQAQGRAVGVVSACVLWSCVGDPRRYDSGPAYRKAMGLNLAERSSGIYQGKLRISKRGGGPARRWLYLAALRLVRQNGLRQWYEARKNEQEKSKRLLIGVVRRLALALYQVGVHQAKFDVRKLFPGAPLA